MIQGMQTNLRAIEHEDGPAVHRWLNDPVVMQGWGRSASAVSRTIVSRQIADWIEREGEIGRPVALIIEALDARPLGLMVAMPEDREARVVRLSLLIGDQEDWGQGHAGDALETFLDAGFNGWNLHRIWLELEAGNVRALRLYRSAGFADEGMMRGARFHTGERHDVHLMGLTAAIWRERQAGSLPTTKAQDPGEPFDIMTSQGTPTGRSKPRWQVHRDGDWHRSIHVWICGIENGAAFIDVQRRDSKRTPGRASSTRPWPGICGPEKTSRRRSVKSRKKWASP